MVKKIQVTDYVYYKLAKMKKKNESFSDLALRLVNE